MTSSAANRNRSRSARSTSPRRQSIGIAADGQAGRERTLAASRADATRLVGAAEADNQAATLLAYRDTDPHILLGIALRELAGQLPNIGTLSLTPDLLTGALARLAGPGAQG